MNRFALRQLERIGRELVELAKQRPTITLKDLGRSRREGLQSRGMAYCSLDFLYDRFSLEMLHPSELTWSVLVAERFDPDFVFELPSDVYAYYFPTLLALFLESLSCDDGSRDSYTLAFSVSISPKCCIDRLSALAIVELTLLRQSVESIFALHEQPLDRFYSHKQFRKITETLDELIDRTT